MGGFDVGPYEFVPTLTEEHHDGASASYGSDIQWIGCRFYDHTNPVIAGPGSAWSFADTGAGLSNLKIRVCVAEEWRGGGLNATAVQALKVLQSTFGNAPGSSSNTTSGDTITVNLASPTLAVATTLVALAPPQAFMKGANTAATNTTLNNTGVLLGALFKGGAGSHMTGATFQLVDMDPASPVGTYNYDTWPATGSNRPWLADKNANLKGVKTSLGYVKANGGGSDITLIPFGTEAWKTGPGGDQTAPPHPAFWSAHIQEIIDFCLAAATANAGAQLITHISAWQESKGHVDLPTTAGWSPNGLPNTGGQGSYPWETDLVTYNPDTYTPNAPGTGSASSSIVDHRKYYAWVCTAFYNALWDAVKQHANPIINTIKVGGNHLGAGQTSTANSHNFPLGNGSTIAPWDYDYQQFLYFLTYAHGLDFISIDYSIVVFGAGGDANSNIPFIVANQDNWGTLIDRVKFYQANHPMVATGTGGAASTVAAKRAAPIDVIEFYYDVDLSRVASGHAGGGAFTEDQQAMMEALILRQLYTKGIRKAYKWAPQGGGQSAFLNQASYIRDTTVDSGTNTSGGLLTPAVPGGKFLAYDAAKLFVDNFPVGTQLYATTCTNPNVACMGSASKVLVINQTSTVQNVTYYGVARAIPAYGVAVYNASTTTSGATLSDVIVDTLATSVTFRGVLARSQYYASSAVAETAIDKNFWRSDWDRAGTNAKTGSVSFVSSTDLHLSTSVQDAATGGPIPTEDADVLLWDYDGRGYGSNPAIGAYASPAVTSPLFSGAATATALTPESQSITFLQTGLTAATTYHYRVSAIRTDGSGGVQVSTDATFTTANATLITTPASWGPTTTVAPTSTVAGGTFVVKSDGKIYDSGGTVLQDFTSKGFNTLVTLKSDTAGTRRALNPGLLNNSQYQAGLIFTELVFNDPAANFEVKAPATTIGLDFQGCSGRLGHWRVVNFAHSGVRLTQSAASVTCGATGSTWSTLNRDGNTGTDWLRLDNCTSHAAGGADGSAFLGVKARNVILGGCDPGFNSTPTGLSGPAYLFDGAALDDVQDVVVGTALDGTPSYGASKAATYTFHLLDCRRSGWQGSTNLTQPVIFANTLGSRPEMPVWLGISGVSPGSETSGNTTNTLVTTDNPCIREGLAQNLVTYTFTNGGTGSQAFEVDATVWNPATPLSSWSDTTPRFIDGRKPLGSRVSGTATVLANKVVIDSAFTISGGAAGSVARAGDGWLEVRGVKFDPGTPTAPIWTGTNVFTVDQDLGLQMKVAAASSGTAIPVYNGTASGGVDIFVTNADGSTPAKFVVVDSKGKTTNAWPVPAGASGPEWVSGIYTNYVDPGTFPAGGVDAVETGVGYRRQLGYHGYDAANSKFTGVVVIPGPTGGAVVAPPVEILSVSQATPGVVTTLFPHGMATNEWCDISGNTQAAANGTFKVTRITNKTFSLQTTGGVNVAIPTPGTGGICTPRGVGGVGYKHGLTNNGASPFPNTLTLPTGTTLDSVMNVNYGQPENNASINIGTDATGIRLIGCDFYDVSIQAAGSSGKIQIVDCKHVVSPLYGKGTDYTEVENGVLGTYDSNNQHDPPRMLGGLNVIAPVEAFWLMERFQVSGAVGDIAPGRFAVGSIMRHCTMQHAKDARNPASTRSTARDGVSVGGPLPKTAPGPHGDIFQNYDRNSITVIGSDLHTNAHSVWFSRSVAGTNFHTATSVPLTNSGGHYIATLANHGANVGDKVLIAGTGDGVLDGKEFVITSKTNGDFTLGATTYVADRVATVTFVIHYTVDWRRNDIRTTKHWDVTDLTDATHLRGKGAVSFQQTEAWTANTNTMTARFYDNRWDVTDNPTGSWLLTTPQPGTSFDLGSPNRNLWRTYGKQGTAVPGGVASPTLS